ncbi:HEAT repeat domain-containing protein [Bacteroidota bacterium]
MDKKKKKIIYHDVDFEIFPDKYKRILERLASSDSSLRIETRNELVDIGTDIIAYLSEILFFNDHHLRWEAAKTINQMAETEGIEIQIKTLEDDQSDIRWIAAEGLVKMGKKSIVPILKKLQEVGTDSIYLIKGAYHVLHKIYIEKELKEKLKPLVKALNSKKHYHQIPALVNALLQEFQ